MAGLAQQEGFKVVSIVPAFNPFGRQILIVFRKYAISIEQEGPLVVRKDGHNVTNSLGLDNGTPEGILRPTADDLFKVMLAIERLTTPASTEVSEALSSIVPGARRM